MNKWITTPVIGTTKKKKQKKKKKRKEKLQKRLVKGIKIFPEKKRKMPISLWAILKDSWISTWKPSWIWKTKVGWV